MMDLSLTDTQRNGSEEARGKLKREVEQLGAETLCGGFEVKNRLLVCLVSLYPKRYSIIVRRGNGGTAYNKGTTTAHTHTRTHTNTQR